METRAISRVGHDLRRLSALRWPLIAVFVVSFSLSGASAGADSDERAFHEYELKAAFIYNFMKFVEWPPEAFAGDESPYEIAIFGEDPFDDVLERLLAGRTLSGRPVSIVTTNAIADCDSSHLVFIPHTSQGRIAEVLTALGDKPILTVGEASPFIEEGGIIRFFVRDEAVRFEINPEAARRCGLTASARLLQVAAVVTTPLTESVKRDSR